MPKLQFCKGKEGGISRYIDMYHKDEGSCMVSWRATDAPVFTLAYRGGEVDALQAAEQESSARSSTVESSDMSRTVLFSHSTGECFVAKECIHLRSGDPQLIVQGVVDAYTEREGVGYEDLCVTELKRRYGSDSRLTGVSGDGRLVNGDDRVFVTSLKAVDVVAAENCARDRVAMMQNFEKKLEMRRACRETSNRLGTMWCGEVTRSAVCGMLSLRQPNGVIRHRMGSVVILTHDPFLQVHMQVDEVDASLLNRSSSSSRRSSISPF